MKFLAPAEQLCLRTHLIKLCRGNFYFQYLLLYFSGGFHGHSFGHAIDPELASDLIYGVALRAGPGATGGRGDFGGGSSGYGGRGGSSGGSSGYRGNGGSSRGESSGYGGSSGGGFGGQDLAWQTLNNGMIAAVNLTR